MIFPREMVKKPADARLNWQAFDREDSQVIAKRLLPFWGAPTGIC